MGRSLWEQSFLLNPDKNLKVNDLQNSEIDIISAFMRKNKIAYISLYRNKELYIFEGHCSLTLSDSLFHDDGIKIGDRMYANYW